MLDLGLPNDWDIAIQPPRGDDPPVGHFVGRKREIDLLVNELLRSPQRSIFISGHRGVGKTSLVYRALHYVRESAPSQKRTFLFVLMNAAQLEAEAGEENEIVPKQILVNLIRRLYTASAEAKLSTELNSSIDALYRKAVAAEFAERFEGAQVSRSEQANELVTERSIAVSDFQPLVWLSSVGVASFLAGLAPFESETLDRVVPLLIAAPLPLVISYLRTKRSSSSVSTVEQNDAKMLYAFDNSIGNLEFDLEGIHRSLTSAQVTVIYVIDELDKLEPDRVIEVLKFFNLFTLSSAIFVFVGGEELASRFTGAPVPEGSIYRPKEYTYFTSQYFLARPAEADLHAYLDDIISSTSDIDQSEEAELEAFKKLLIFDAHGDFFDVIRRVRDRITSFDGTRPLIHVDRFTIDEDRRIALQQALSLLFSEKYEVVTPSRWGENEDVLRSLYSAAHEVARAHGGTPFPEELGESVAAAARRDFFTLLGRLGILSIVSTQEVEIAGRMLSVSSYEYVGGARLQVPDALDFLSEPETAFVQDFQTLLMNASAVHNVDRTTRRQSELEQGAVFRKFNEYLDLSQWGIDLTSLLPTSVDTYSRLTSQRPPQTFSREHIENAREEVRTAGVALEQGAPNALARIFAAQVRDAAISSLSADPGAFSEDTLAPLRAELLDLPHALVTRPDRVLLITSSLDESDVRRHANAFRTYEKTHHVLAIGQAESELRTKPKGFRTLSWQNKDGNNRK